MHFRLQYALWRSRVFDARGQRVIRFGPHSRFSSPRSRRILRTALECARSPQIRAAPCRPRAFALAAINVWYRNHQFHRVVDFITREEPDFALARRSHRRLGAGSCTAECMYPHRFTTRGRRASRTPAPVTLADAGRGAARLSDAEPAVTATSASMSAACRARRAHRAGR